MPEGDTLYRVARTLHKALGGQVVRRFESAYAPLLRIDEESPLVGRTVQRVEARGKWCLIWLGPCVAPGHQPERRPHDGVIALATHLRMSGMWHVYRAGRGGKPDEPWQRPARDMRVLLATDSFVAVGFRVPVAELLTEDAVERHRDLGRLGPDLLGESFDEAEALRRLRLPEDRELGEALLDQSAVAGIGNVYKSELCFLVSLNPFLPMRAVPDDALRKLLAIARRLLRENSVITATGPAASRRRTTAAMDPGRRLWVYGRAGLPCRRCGAPISERRQLLHARVTFFCPHCQPLPAGTQ